VVPLDRRSPEECVVISSSGAAQDLHNTDMTVTPRSQNAAGSVSQDATKQTEQRAAMDPLEATPTSVPPTSPLSEDRAALLDDVCRSLDGSDTRISRGIDRSHLEKALPWDTDPRLVADALARVARLTPGYWADRAISGAHEATSMSAAVIGTLLVDCGICALFAIAVFSVAVAVGRARARSAL